MRDTLTTDYRQFLSFMRFVVGRFLHDNCRQNAMVLTYTTLFAVVPVMTVTFAILSAIPSLQHVSADIQNFVFSHFIPSTGMEVQAKLQEFSQQARGLTVVGIGMLFVTALMMLVTIEKSFNQIWRVREARKGVVSFLRYWAVLSLGPLLLGAGFAISSYLASMRLLSDAASVVGGVIPGLQILPFITTSLAFTLLYVTVPNCKVPLRAGIAGGLMAAALFELAKTGFGIFVGQFSSYTLVYGAFAAFPVFLIWIYLSWMIILFGVEVTRGLAVFRHTSMVNRHPVLALMDVLQLFWRKQQHGASVSDVEAMSILGKQEVEIWFDFVDILQRERMIHRTDTGSYVLTRNLEHIDFADFYRSLPWPLPRPADLDRLHVDDHWVTVLRPALLRVHEAMERELHVSLASIVADEVVSDVVPEAVSEVVLEAPCAATDTASAVTTLLAADDKRKNA
ncbi:MAG: YihY family inner membrane protein [Moraxellaceae bacterium]|nr:YihY family inner membrane protein [Moraxellaceae bacterium]